MRQSLALFMMGLGICAAGVAESNIATPSQIAPVPLSAEPARVLYQIYVESFKDGVGADGHGDLAGLASKLDYLHDLGIRGLLLMPVFDADDGMGYIPRDFYALRPDYAGPSTEAEREQILQNFIREAHARDIRIYLDTPINHISYQSTWFINSARRTPGYENWFLWADHPLEGWRIPWEPSSTPKDVWNLNQDRGAWYYALFGWGMPEFNHRAPEVITAFDRFFAHYAQLGVDGFRIDAAKHLIEANPNTAPAIQDNVNVLKHYLETVRRRFPQVSFLLEVWSGYDEIEAFPRESGDIMFDFPYMSALRDSLKYSHPYGVRNSLHHLMSTQNTVQPGNRIVFAGNHDIPRLRTYVENDEPRAELGLALTLTLPYIPLVYYGDEILMSGDYIRYPLTPEKNQNDVCMPMLWSATPNAGFAPESVQLGDGWNKRLQGDWRKVNVETQLQRPNSFLNRIRALTQARANLPITPRTRLFVDKSDDSDPVLKTAMLFEDGTCSVALYNFSNQRQNFRQLTYPSVCAVESAKRLVQSRAWTRQSDTVDLDPYGYWVGTGVFPRYR